MARRLRCGPGLLAMLAAAPALASYINPLPYDNTFDLGGDIGAAAYPFLGKWGSDTGPGDTFHGQCSASAIATTTRPAKTFILTAAHCAGGLAEGHSWQFELFGDGRVIRIDDVHAHPKYKAADKRNDIAVAASSSTPEDLKTIGVPGRDIRIGRTTLFSAGFGNTGFDGAANTGSGTRRRIFTEISAFDDARDEFTMPRAGSGGNTPQGIDPVRHTCHGDSGGPALLLDGTLVGVHSRVGGGNTDVRGGTTVSRCDGSQLRMTEANLTRQENRVLVGSYVLATIFLDWLRLDTQQEAGFVDGFEPDPAAPGSYAYGAVGLAPGWQPLPAGQFVAHPAFMTPIGGNAGGWEFFNAIGTTAVPASGTGAPFDDPEGDPGPGRPDLFTNGASSQGATRVSGGPAIIYRDFVAGGASVLHLDLDVRWNSLGLSSDVGIQRPDGQVVWRGLSSAVLADVDRWRTVTLDVDLGPFAGPQVIRVLVLVNGEPAATCDIDANGVVDRNDVNAIFSARNTAAAGGDPRDVDRDGFVTVNDARVCSLRCTNARCAP